MINEAAIALMSRMGIEVIVPSGLGCCGAIEHHLGEEEKALHSARRNVDILKKLHEEKPLDAIINTASGCGSMLKDYAHLLRNDVGYAKRAGDIAHLTRDITEVLAGHHHDRAKAMERYQGGLSRCLFSGAWAKGHQTTAHFAGQSGIYSAGSARGAFVLWLGRHLFLA